MRKGLIKTAVLVFLGVLLVSLPLVGCDDDEEITIATERLTQGIAAAGDIGTFHYDRKQTREINFDSDDKKYIETISTETNIIMDNSNQKFYMMQIEEFEHRDIIEDEESWKSQQWEQYIIGNVEYNKTSTKSSIGDWAYPWEKRTFDEAWWEEAHYQSFVWQIELLEISEIEILGSEKVNGVECWVIKLPPSLELYLEVGGEEFIGEIEEITQEELSERISVKQWFSKDTYFLMKAEMELTILVPWISTTITTVTEYSSYNEPVSIELPPEAEAAEWVE